MRSHQPTKNYVTGRRAGGKSTGEIVRIVKRYGAREVLKQLRPLAVDRARHRTSVV